MLQIIAACAVAVAAGDAPDQAAPGTIHVSAVLLKLVEQVDVPSQEASVLDAVRVHEGQMVSAGDELARLDDTKAVLAEQRAKHEASIAQAEAENDVNVRYAEKAVAVARADLRRAEESNEKYPGSISETEMDRLRLTVQKLELEVEQAKHELEIAVKTAEIKENELAVAREDLQRRRILAPLDGVVVQVNRHPGEWVEPGDAVLRVLRIDPLRAEGFLKFDDLKHEPLGRPVSVRVRLPGGQQAAFPGKIVFIAPEIDPVNAQVRVWADIENRDLKLRPGMRAEMVIDVSPGQASGQTAGQ